MLPDIELAEIQARTLFAHDESGRLLHTTDPEPTPAPRLFLARTGGGCIVRMRYDVSDELADQLTALAASEPSTDAPDEPFAHLDAYRRLLATAAPVEREHCGPAFVISDDAGDPGGAALLPPDFDAGVLDVFGHTAADWAGRQPYAALLKNGTPVSLCFVARSSDVASEAGVETRSEHRDRGYARQVVACWAHEVRRRRRLPLYSTSWHNQPSRRVAAKLRARLYAVDLHFT